MFLNNFLYNFFLQKTYSFSNSESVCAKNEGAEVGKGVRRTLPKYYLARFT